MRVNNPMQESGAMELAPWKTGFILAFIVLLVGQSAALWHINPPPMLKILLLQPRTIQDRSQAAHTTEPFPDDVQLQETRQFTKRRMRTFIATPSARNVNSTEDPP